MPKAGAKQKKQAKPQKPAAKKPLVATQPVSKPQAALSAGMFLYTNDSWSARYFDPSDLHCIERKVFG
jgi:hypothetical protein